MLVSDQEIKRVVTSVKEYRYGCYIDGRDIIERMTISLDDSSQCLRINARVKDHQNQFVLSIKLTHKGEILSYHCGCGLETPKSACRHSVALLKLIQKLNIQEFPYFYEKNQEEKKSQYKNQQQQKIIDKKHQESLDLLDLYKNKLINESQIPLLNRQYQLIAHVSYQEHLIINLKISHQSQSFVIKNIGKFLEAIDHHETKKYGKSFEFVHSLDAFDEDSLDLLYFIKDCYLRNQGQSGIIKSLVVSEDILDDFYDIMKALPSSYSDIMYRTKDYKIRLELKEVEDSYVLIFKQRDYIQTLMRSKKHLYDYQNDCLYRLRLDEDGQCLLLVDKLMNNSEGLFIRKDMIAEFYRFVLNDIMDHIELETHLFDDYMQENSINLYVDMTAQEQVCIQLEYIYDDHICYGFDEKNQQLSANASIVENYLSPVIEDEEDHMIYLKYDFDFTYSFLHEGLAYLAHYCDIYVSDAIKAMQEVKPLAFEIGVSVESHLLDFHIESDLLTNEELKDILKAYKKQRKFYRLKNGQLVSLEDQSVKEFYELSEVLQLQDQDLNEGHVQVPTYRLFEVEGLLNQQEHLHYFKSEDFNQYLNQFENPIEPHIPENYQKILRNYQVDGVKWLTLMEHYGFSGILADDMGLGKTLQMIVYLELMKHYQMPSLVITPASLLLNWQEEIRKFSKNLKVLSIYGNKEERHDLIQCIEEYDVVITSYDYIRRDIDDYEDILFHSIIIDEAQYIKNAKTRNALCVKRLKAKQRFALSGTPIENSLAELWSIFDFLMPHYLYVYSYFLEHFEKPIVKDHDEKKQRQLKQMISPFILRRNKKEVLTELPEKIEKTMLISFSEEEKKLYLSTLVNVNKELQQKLNIQNVGKVQVLAMLTRLRQLCQDPRLLYPDLKEASSKIKGCMELIHSLKENNKKVLLFSSFTSVLELIRHECDKEHISYYQLDGSVSKEKRQEYVDKFQKDDTTLFLISLKAGGSGLNLTAAQAVIHIDPWWNISAQNQATDRAYRIGQKESVNVYSFIMKDSIEEKIQELQKNKKNLADMFVEGNEGVVTTMNVDDLMALLSINE